MARTVALSRLSDPLKGNDLDQLIQLLRGYGFTVFVSSYLDKDVPGSLRAKEVNAWFAQNVDAIFDVSGGDLAIETVPFLDIRAYANSSTLFFGYSDLTVVLNVLGKVRPCGLFQIRHLIRLEECISFLTRQDRTLFYDDTFYVGGNIRCLLKLAGTRYFPDMKGQHLFLESRSGSWYRIRSYLKQLELLETFDQIASLSLGQFTQLDQQNDRDKLLDWARNLEVPVHTIEEVGHAPASKALWIKEV